MTSRAMWSDGAWLNGLSKPESVSNRKPGTPDTAGRAKVKRSGTRMKQATAMSCELRPAGADEQRQAVEKVDRPVGDDRPRHEGDPLLPAEHDRAGVGAERGQP